MTAEVLIRTQLVCFDLDGVITNTMPFHFQAWKQILENEGLAISEYDVYSREGQKGAESVRDIFADYGKAISHAQALKILSDKEILFKNIVRLEFIPGSLEFLDFLSEAGFTLALVTGTSRHELEQYVPADVLKYFKVIVTGTDVRNGKPHPEPYQTALKQLGFEPLEAVVIENAPLGVASAKAAGIRCLALETSLPRRYLAEADFVFSSVEELRSVVSFRHLKNFGESRIVEKIS